MYPEEDDADEEEEDSCEDRNYSRACNSSAADFGLLLLRRHGSRCSRLRLELRLRLWVDGLSSHGSVVLNSLIHWHHRRRCRDIVDWSSLACIGDCSAEVDYLVVLN